MECRHLITQGRDGESGSWCFSCGEKVLAVEERECKDCTHYKKLLVGSICSRHLMAVMPSMHVTYKVKVGTCFVSGKSDDR